ncbi:MAG: hypothetical protein A2519_08110 [Candidatus Raymondbacteria bacterium RIFOXYD12_FULL_49_13]|uniref:Uncharacterized protein n=1 Tax=Candidatus Raymondbacteria bacterium RIFOXYD12_FULL_49_13 TaxID=1817890 RepID=A0A1F7F2P9_UNCRA|nr:MAG: hypothetical protein A2519_08110 [Candidatus Raymondbacteria bacterium RIFOXYD12_FULL_49_13]
MLAPKDSISDLLPLFEWTPVPGVPYYHLLLSDQPIDFSTEGISNASFIWQVISSGNQIRYGSPDPSGIFPAPPPLTPGIQYQWVMLNNYGNTKEYTSIRAYNIPKIFVIKGSVNVTPPDTSTMKTLASGGVELHSFYDSTGIVSVDTTGSDSITLSWGRCTDPAFNLYKIYLYNVIFDSSTNSDAGIIIWSRNTLDTSVTIEARSFLADSVLHEWKVFVENTSGAGIASKKKAFFYNITGIGTIHYRTREIIGSDTVAVKFANVAITPLEGGGLPFDVPTNDQGIGSKSVLYGTYRIEANPDGYVPISRDITVTSTETDPSVYFTLERYSAGIFGVIKDSLNNTIANAKITAVSEYQDTFVTYSSSTGSFDLSVTPESWTVFAEKAGYQRSTEYSITVAADENKSPPPSGAVVLRKFKNLISGSVTNSVTYKPIINASVTLSRNGSFIRTAYSDNSGNYSFSVDQGTGYGLEVSREGFSSRIISNISVAGNVTYNVSLASGIGMINGIAYVTSHHLSATTNSFVTSGREGVVVAAISAARDTAAKGVTWRDNTYSLSLPAGTYTLVFSGDNLITDSISVLVTALQTLDTNVYLQEYATISGVIKALDLAGANLKVTVTAQGGILNGTYTVQSELATGEYTIPRLDSGSYTVTFGQNGYNTKSVTVGILDTTISGRSYLKSVLVPDDTLDAGDKTVSWQIDALGQTLLATNDSTSLVKIKFPSRLNLAYTQDFTNASPGTYVVGTMVINPSVINIDSLSLTLLTATTDTTIVLNHPLKHIALAIADTAGLTNDTVRLKLIVDDPLVIGTDVTSAAVYYRDQSENDFKSVSTFTRSGDTLVFKVLPTVDNSVMKYYFTARIGSIAYINRYKLFSTRIPSAARIKYISVEPYAWDQSSPAILPWNASVAFRVTCLNGSFLPVAPSRVSWNAPNRTGLTFTNRSSQSMNLSIARNTSINDTLVSAVRCTVVATGGWDTVVTTYFLVKKLRIDTLLIIGNSFDINSGEDASFGVVGVNIDSNQQFSAVAAWSADPALETPYGFAIDNSGTFRAPSHYINTVALAASAYGKTTQTDLKIKQFLAAGDSSWAGNGNGFLLTISSRVFPDAPQEFYLKEAALNTVAALKAVQQTIQVVSPVYTMSFSETYNTVPADTMNIYIDIPAIARGKEILVGRWNQRATTWETQTNVAYVDENLDVAPVSRATKMLFKTTTIGGAGDPEDGAEYALLVNSIDLGIYALKVGPSPFSPFVTVHAPNETPWKGCRVEFETASQKSIDVLSEATVFNTEGNMVVNLSTMDVGSGKLSTTGGFYGSKSFKRAYVWDGTNRNGRMSRNGRYFIRIMVDDGVDRVYRTVPVVLFK